MAQVSVSIGGRGFRLACNPGEEPHLEALARTVDEKISRMRASFGEIGDQRLVVMAALTIADELNEAQKTASRADAPRRGGARRGGRGPQRRRGRRSGAR